MLEYRDRWNQKRRLQNVDYFRPDMARRYNSARPTDHPGYERPNVDTGEELGLVGVYQAIKMMASFMNRNNVTGGTSIKTAAKNLLSELRRQNNHQPVSGYGALNHLATGVSSGWNVYTDMYRYLYQFLHIYVNDIETNNPKHQCTRDECGLYCILPLYANRCMSDRKVNELYMELRSIIYRNPTLVATSAETNESETAQNILKFLSSKTDHNLSEAFDLLYVMSGHKRKIFDLNIYVDSRLYELVFDHLRSFDYKRLSRDRLQSLPKSHLPWLSDQEAIDLELAVCGTARESIPPAGAAGCGSSTVEGSLISDLNSNSGVASRTTNHRSAFGASRPLDGACTRATSGPGGNNTTEPPPSYDSLSFLSAPEHPDSATNEDNDQLPTYEQVLRDMVDISEPGTETADLI